MSATYSPLRNNINNNSSATSNSGTIKPNPTTREASPLLLPVSAPIAKSEIDDDTDSREVVTTPYPGVDDGFFKDTEKSKGSNPDVETINPDVEVLSKPKDPEPIEPTDDTPSVFDRLDPGDIDNPTDGVDGKKPTEGNPEISGDGKSEGPNEPPYSRPRRPSYIPGFGTDIEVGSIPGDFPESIPDVNIYQHKKTLAQGMMDLALFSANANQLRYVLESYARHPYFFPSIIFISFSLILQVGVGIGLIWNATYNVKDKREICIANRINNFTVIGIFLVTVVNVFISAFGVATPQST